MARAESLSKKALWSAERSWHQRAVLFRTATENLSLRRLSVRGERDGANAFRQSSPPHRKGKRHGAVPEYSLDDFDRCTD